MKENAIIIRHLDIIKVYVDFSNIDNIYQAINAERLSTIHTAKTQEISSLLGVHLMGFVDREGDDINNSKACEISGYDYLGSFMLLCKTDNKLNPLPFEENELECVYHYLTTGEVKSKEAYRNDELGQFFAKYDIKVILPNLPVEPKATFFEEYPKIVLLTYDFNNASGEELTSIGEELFNYSDILVKKFYEEDNALVSPGEDYCVKNKTDMGKHMFYVLIQVLEGRRDKPIIGDIDNFIGSEKEEEEKDNFSDVLSGIESLLKNNGMLDEKEENDEEELEDESSSFEDELEETNDYEEVDEPEEYEEVEDEEFSTNADFLVPYFIKVEIHATWPEFEQTGCDYTYCYPMLQAMEPEEDQPFFPYFANLIKVRDFDMFKDTVDITLNLGKEKRKVHLDIDKPYSFEFDYTPGKPTSHRYGMMTLTFERHEIDSIEVEGTIRITETVLELGEDGNKKKVLNREKDVLRNISNINDHIGDDSITELSITGARYFPWLISEDGSFILLSAARDDENDASIRRHIYIPLYLGEENVSHDRFVSTDDLPVDITVEIIYTS